MRCRRVNTSRRYEGTNAYVCRKSMRSVESSGTIYPASWHFIVTAEQTSSVEGWTCFVFVSRISHSLQETFVERQYAGRQAATASEATLIMTAAFSCCKIWHSQRLREQVSPKPRWHFKDHDFVQQYTWVSTFLQMFVEFFAFYYILSILTYAVPPTITNWHLYVLGLLYRMTLRTEPSDRDVRTRSAASRNVDLGTRYVTVCVMSLVARRSGGEAR
jgi:hypothetical protein